jgi:lysophospholipase L1-like esterase
MEFSVQNDARYLRRASVLKDKKVLFCGDSICSAAVYDYKDCPRWGWAGRSSSVTGLQYINKGLDGASLSTCRKDNRILFQIEACKDEKFDLIVLHGGVNDGWDAIAPGKMAEGFELEGFDTTTCCGGLEELLYYVKKYFPESKVCYLVNFATPSSKIGALANMDPYFDEMVKILEKWNIPTLDLYHNPSFAEEFKVTERVYTADFVHPNAEGYDVLYPHVVKFLEAQF